MAGKSLKLISPHTQSLNDMSESVAIDRIATLEVQMLIDEMLVIANGLQGDAKKPTMVGLAAPQLGVNKRIIIVDVASTGMGEKPELRVYVNPAIVSKSDEVESGREGCYSTGKICGIVQRSQEVTIDAYDRNGTPIREKHAGFPARIFQHEVDHLDGIRFPDRIDDDNLLHWVEPKQFGDYRAHWQDWKVHCKRETWYSLKQPLS